MTLESFFLVCFLVGFLLSLVSFVGQDFHFHGHVPHFGHGGHHAGTAHGASAVNMMTATAFLAWFGGAGYLLQRYSGLWLWLAVGLAVLSGLTGATAVFWIVRKLLEREQWLDPADYDMVGVLGRVSSVAHEGGVGEMIFSQQGVRRAAAIRSEDGLRLEKGTEVVVTRYHKGIAYVRRWDDVIDTEQIAGLL